MLLPVIWTGIGLWHFVAEHTHTFCTNDTATHIHQNMDDCVSICQLTNNPLQQYFSSSFDYQELKVCLSPNLNLKL